MSKSLTDETGLSWNLERGQVFTILYGKKSQYGQRVSPVKIQFVIALFLFVFFLNRMPAYDNNPWSSLFFVIFIIVCMYIFVSIFLAVVYKNYRKHLKVDYRYVVLNIVYFAVMVGYYFLPFHAFTSSILFISSFRLQNAQYHRLSQSPSLLISGSGSFSAQNIKNLSLAFRAR